MANTTPDTLAWRAQTWLSFVIAAALMLGGTVMLPVDIWIKGYLFMGTLFLVGSTFSLSKSLRDTHESLQYHRKLEQAKSNKLLKEFELENATVQEPGRRRESIHA
jgi:hypothetical protein